MCGIAGYVGGLELLEKRQECVQNMLQALRPRGPDGIGLWAEGHAAIGHVRLAIIAPQDGAQPMLSAREGRRAVVTYGGEVYNYPELRADLKRLGHTFAGQSDTEVLLRGYFQWGIELFTRCRGMFALAIWEPEVQRLTLARDPLGIKPLFFLERDGCVQFASEPKGLLQGGLASATVSTQGLCELFTMWPYRTPGAGIYQNVSEVLPGQILQWHQGRKTAIQYWRLEPGAHVEARPAADAIDQLRSVLRQTIEMQLRSDVPVGVALSGGLDSSLIGYMAVRTQKWERARTFSVGYESPLANFVPSAFRPEPDEPYIELAARELRTQHEHIVLAAEDVHAALSGATRSRDLPDTGDMDASLMLMFSKIGGTGTKVILTGEGADEVFGGYPWFAQAQDADFRAYPWRRYLCFWEQALLPEVRAKLKLEEYALQRLTDALNDVPLRGDESRTETRLKQMRYLDITRFLPGQLERMDRASMSNGVEARVPYCDSELVRLAWQLPLNAGADGQISKPHLRSAAAGVLPDAIRLRKKASYPTLGGSAHEQLLRGEVEKALQDRQWAFAEMLDKDTIRSAMNGTLSAPSRATVWLGRIASLYRWSKMYGVSANY